MTLPDVVTSRRWPHLATVLFLLAIASTAQAQPTAPPPSRPLPTLAIGPPGPAAFRDLFAHADEWRQARAATGLLLYADHNLQGFSDAELQGWFATMRVWRIPLELEVGAIKEWGATADETFRAEQPLWDRALRLGADLASIAMDEPLVASRAMLHKPDQYAIEQTARFVALVRHRYPGLRIGDIEPYPSIPLADHMAWLQALQQRIGGLGAAPLDFYRLDVDWVAFNPANHGSWREVASLGDGTRRLGLPFSLIYWAAGYPAEKARGVADEGTWYREVMQQGAAFAATGGRPQQFVVESWVGAPSQTVPDTADFTFTRSVLDLARRFVPGDH